MADTGGHHGPHGPGDSVHAALDSQGYVAMSILYLQNVLKLRGTKRATKAIIVSSALFDALYQSADLRPRRQDWPPLTEPACRKVIDAWLSTEGLPASAQLPNVTWHLVWFQGAKVVRDTDVGLTLNSEGPGSFEIV